MPVAITCSGCGKVHEFPVLAAAENVWCSGCGQLIAGKPARQLPGGGALAPPPPVVIPPPRFGPPDVERRARPIAVLVALVALAVALFMELVIVMAAFGIRPPAWLLVGIFLFPMLLIWIGLLLRSPGACRIATVGGPIVALLLCHFTLRQQIELWGSDPPAWDLLWGVLRVLVRSLPLLVVSWALSTQSARDYFQMDAR